MGSNKQHLKIVMDFGFEVLCWNQAEFLKLQEDGDRIINVKGKLVKSIYMGHSSITFQGEVLADE